VACGLCVEVCPYDAVELVEKRVLGHQKRVAQINPALCMGCGACVASCRSASIDLVDYSNEKVMESVRLSLWNTESRTVLATVEGERWDPTVVVFLCQWCLKAQVDWLKRYAFSNKVKVVEVPCSGRVNPFHIISAFQEGADGVLVVGCALGECHYKSGNLLAERKFCTLQRFLEYIGFEPDRFRYAWIGSTEQGKFHRLVEKMIEDLRAMGPMKKTAAPIWQQGGVVPLG